MQTRAASKRAQQESLELSQSIPAATGLDPELWGTLPPELLLKIYKSMLIHEFYQLRVVCKDWNRVACERRCFSDRIPKPYFVLIQHCEKNAPTGTLAYNVSSGKWMWKFLMPLGGTGSPGVPRWRNDWSHSLPITLGLHLFGDFLESFAVEGILFGKGCSHLSLLRQCERSPDHIFLFDLQAGRKVLDFVTFGSSTDSGKRAPQMEGSTVGMMVDTSKKPRSVKLIVGSCSAGTLILDSQTRTWETKPSRMVRGRAASASKTSPKSCIACDGCMYIWADLDEIQVFSVEGDQWSTLDPPPRHAEHQYDCSGLGHWEKEVYAVTMNEEGTVSVWKLGATQEWSEFERMPSHLWAYLLQPWAKLHTQVPKFVIASHCNEYFLMHVSTYGGAHKKQGRRHVLFNIASKRWETVEILKPGIRT